jgi:hypothetical protein
MITHTIIQFRQQCNYFTPSFNAGDQVSHKYKTTTKIYEDLRFSLFAPPHTGSLLADFLFSSTLKMEAIHSSKTSVNTISTRHHIPEDCSLQEKYSFVCSNFYVFRQQTIKTKVSELNGRKHCPNVICSSFPHESNLDLLLLFQNI